jgi:hypothetical protein
MCEKESCEPEDPFFPGGFATSEEVLLQLRRKQAAANDLQTEEVVAPQVGLALSGGGIRSAIFNLGVLQGLSERGVLPQVDYLSTVSGGGYIGGWYGALVHRLGLLGAKRALNPGTDKPSSGHDPAFNWLRENGFYLAPKGVGDEVVLAATALRNWVAIWVELAVAFTVLFLLLNLRWVLPALDIGAKWFWPGLDRQIWWSPWLWVPLAAFCFAVFPLGWAYWLVHDPKAADGPRGLDPKTVGRELSWALSGLFFVLGLGRCWWQFSQLPSSVQPEWVVWLCGFSHSFATWLSRHLFGFPQWLHWCLGNGYPFLVPTLFGIGLIQWMGFAWYYLATQSTIRRATRIMVFQFSLTVLPQLAGFAVMLVWGLSSAGLGSQDLDKVGVLYPVAWLGLHSWALWGVGAIELVYLVLACLANRSKKVFPRRAWANPPNPAAKWSKISRWLSLALLVTAGFLVLALVDSFGQSSYAILRERGVSGLKFWVSGALVALVGAISSGRYLQTWAGSAKRSVSLPLGILAGLLAAVLMGSTLVGLDALVHGLTWGFASPADCREPQDPALCRNAPVGQILLHNAGAQITQATLVVPQENSRIFLEGRYLGASPILVSLREDRHLAAELPALPGDSVPTNAGQPSLCWFLVSLGMTLFLTSRMGRVESFLNQSGLGYLYGRRIVRTFLGAVNQCRTKKGRQVSVRTEAEGDDFQLGSPTPEVAASNLYAPWQKGGPLHLINVTINETVDGSSQIQQRDRKGLGMAVGPCGITVGARHHARWTKNPKEGSGGACLMGLSQVSDWNVFPPEQLLSPELPTLGTWIELSGAAFGTGMGFRSSVGISLLFGFLNIRTGRWWYSGVPSSRVRAQTLGLKCWNWISRSIPVQAHLLEEFIGRFPGTARSHWYLSDGGHFENTGVYELARRKVPLIVLCDCGEDADYVFEDFANLVLKLRNDFSAELKFVKELTDFAGTQWNEGFQRRLAELGKLFDCEKPITPWPSWEHLQRGRWADKKGQESLDQRMNEGFSKAHWSLAAITYPDSSVSVMVVIKPALTEDAPMDLLYYHQQHPEYPQQSTLDQFFDETQWEAYRKLGELSASVALR